jgi:hypothetical protein
MVSPTYQQFAQAMAARKQIVCEYDGYARELCAVILGHTGGQAAERRAEHLAAAPAIALMVNEGNHREARAGGGVGDRRPATIGVPAQDLGFVTQTQASYGVDAVVIFTRPAGI